MRKIEQYSIKDGKTPLNAEELSFRFLDIDGRLHQLELLKISWQDAVAEIQNHGLERINSVVQPILDAASALVDDAQADLDSMSNEWSSIQDGWADMADTISAIQSTISTIQSDVADLQSSIDDLLDSPPTPVRFAQMGLVSIQDDLVKIPAGVAVTISKVTVIVGTAPAGGPCSIVFMKNGADNIFTSGTLEVADGTTSISTTSLQNNSLAATDHIRVDATAANGAKDLMLVIEF